MPLFSMVALILVGISDGLHVNEKSGGYEDIVVSVSNDVPPITCQQLLTNLQVCISHSFSSLYNNGGSF